MTLQRTVNDILATYLPSIEAGMRRGCALPDAGLGTMIRYHLGWEDENGGPVTTDPGKRLRPGLVLLATEANGGTVEQGLSAAVAVELLHNFSLVHDDIQDQSPTRRGRATVWKIWGEAQAINAGDLLHVIAQRQLLGIAEAVGVPRAIAALNSFAAASFRLCEGQHLDLHFETRNTVTEDDYLDMIGGKTAALIGCCLELGAIVGSTDPAVWAQYRAIGIDLGLAFQVWDDYLGVWGDSARTGKPVAEDILNRKKTLPVAFAFSHAEGDDKALLEVVYSTGAARGSVPVDRLLDLFERIGARAYTHELADTLISRALAQLSDVPGSADRKQDLETVARFFVGRDY